MRQIALLDAPSNLGLRPPAPGVTPGCYKLPGALRDQRLLKRLDAREAGVLTPPRYLSDWVPGEGDRNAEAIAVYSRRLADRIGALVEEGAFPLVLGGDCSILLGSMLALKRRGRFGLAFFDGHSDFRHPGKAAPINAAAGEDLALVTGRGDSRLIDLEGLGASVRDEDVVLIGVRDADLDLAEVRALGMEVHTADHVGRVGCNTVIAEVLRRLEERSSNGFWIHCDLDVVDGAILPAVDSPEPKGLDYASLATMLRALARSPKAIGAQITIFDPDLDPDGRHAAAIAHCLVSAFAPVG
jgi:arginase